MADKAEHAHNAGNPEIIDLATWLQTPIGNYLRQWEQHHLNALTADIFGFNAVQIGSPQIHALQANRMPYRWLADKHMPVEGQSELEVPQVVTPDTVESPSSR